MKGTDGRTCAAATMRWYDMTVSSTSSTASASCGRVVAVHTVAVDFASASADARPAATARIGARAASRPAKRTTSAVPGRLQSSVAVRIPPAPRRFGFPPPAEETSSSSTTTYAWRPAPTRAPAPAAPRNRTRAVRVLERRLSACAKVARASSIASASCTP